jgi:hypothetical protein
MMKRTRSLLVAGLIGWVGMVAASTACDNCDMLADWMHEHSPMDIMEVEAWRNMCKVHWECY